MSGPFRVLVVCTGNICRSPMAQAFLAHRLRELLGDETYSRDFLVESAGTYGLTGEPVEPSAAEVLRGHGVSLDAFAARELTPVLIDAADLVLAATRDHRTAVVNAVPQAAAKTFTLLEFARLASATDASGTAPAGDAADRARHVVADALSRRGMARPDWPGDDDVADPYRRPQEAFVQAGNQIKTAVDAIAAALAGSPD